LALSYSPRPGVETRLLFGVEDEVGRKYLNARR
jgi:hypothetical protein